MIIYASIIFLIFIVSVLIWSVYDVNSDQKKFYERLDTTEGINLFSNEYSQKRREAIVVSKKDDIIKVTTITDNGIFETEQFLLNDFLFIEELRELKIKLNVEDKNKNQIDLIYPLVDQDRTFIKKLKKYINEGQI